MESVPTANEPESKSKEDVGTLWDVLTQQVQASAPTAEEAARTAAVFAQQQLAAERARREPVMAVAKAVAAQILHEFLAQQPALLADGKDQFQAGVQLSAFTMKHHMKLVVTLVSHFVTSALWRKGYQVDFNQHATPPTLSIRWQKVGSIHPTDVTRLECGCWPSDHREGVWSTKNHSLAYIQSEVAECWLVDDSKEEDVGRKSQRRNAFETEWHDKLCCLLRHGANPVATAGVEKK